MQPIDPKLPGTSKQRFLPGFFWSTTMTFDQSAAEQLAAEAAHAMQQVGSASFFVEAKLRVLEGSIKLPILGIKQC